MRARNSNTPTPSETRWRIVTTAIGLYGRIGHNKTTVADIARELSMSPANVYRFFSSKRAIDGAAVDELLEAALIAVSESARNPSTAIDRLRAVLQAAHRLNVQRFQNEKRLHELVVTAMREQWPEIEASAERMTLVLAEIVGAGQARGELGDGDSIVLARCTLAATEAHLNPVLSPLDRARPELDQMISFCISALRAASPTCRQAAADSAEPRAA